MSVNNHGRVSNYSSGKCRCNSCVEVYKEAQKRWKAKNPTYFTDYCRSWRKTNPDFPAKNRANVRRYRAAKKEATMGDIEETNYYSKILEKDPCCYCGTLMEHVDHIVPLSKGGDHSWENLTSSCQHCNDSKRADSLLGFLLGVKD